ncbi:MAG: hypothetical protein KJZ93_11535 [Caldilineaceae bacterium]|nr:hypothetical protein [Caldilineaceae bacterium]
MFMRTRMKWFRMVLLTLVAAGALSVTGLALAQSSNYFDLGCWGFLTGGGAVRRSATAQVQDALGLPAVGVSTSVTALGRSGHLHQWQPAAPAASPGQPLVGENRVYLSSVWAFVRQVRACS